MLPRIRDQACCPPFLVLHAQDASMSDSSDTVKKQRSVTSTSVGVLVRLMVFCGPPLPLVLKERDNIVAFYKKLSIAIDFNLFSMLKCH